ncbi:MAG TPA: hypothetical protein VF042_14395, partial [Gemmatimonadaceae bacterium]
DEDRARLRAANSEMGQDSRSPEATVFDMVDVGSWSRIAKFARNDFESAVAARHPRLNDYLERLKKSRAILSGMTGSGSTVYAILDSPPDYSKVPEEHRQRVTTTRTSIDVVQPVRVG